MSAKSTATFEGVLKNKRGQFIAQMIDPESGKQRFIGRYASRNDADEALVEAKERAVAAARQSPFDGAADERASDPATGLTAALSELTTDGEVAVEVREALRNLVARVDVEARRPTPAAHFGRPLVAARMCRFGAACRRADVLHWQE
jgi:hypothetical protein